MRNEYVPNPYDLYNGDDPYVYRERDDEDRAYDEMVDEMVLEEVMSHHRLGEVKDGAGV